MNITAIAQSTPEITGLYSLGSSSPEGGSHLFVLEDGNYAIAYFGGVQIGKWEFSKNNTFKFTPNDTEDKFELYGRHNKELKNKTKILFRGFEDGQTFIQLNKEKEEENILQRVFNQGANGFAPRYVHEFNTIANSISFMSIQYNDPTRSIITIVNPEKYNDFVATFTKVDGFEGEPFFAEFKNNKLYFEDDDASERYPIEEGDEDVEFIKNIIDKEFNRNEIYLNPSYKSFYQLDEDEPQDIHERHIFNEEKNAFIDTVNYVEGAEYNNSSEAYDDMSIIYTYQALKKCSKKTAKFKINEKSLFHATCDW